MTRVHKIRPSKKCGYKGRTGSTKRSRRNLNLPEEPEKAPQEGAR
jgi:hypothetical protein